MVACFAHRQPTIAIMPSFAEVGDYLDSTNLEAELSNCVAECVEDERPQPLFAIAEALMARAAALAVDWDYEGLTADVRELIEREGCGPQTPIIC